MGTNAEFPAKGIDLRRKRIEVILVRRGGVSVSTGMWSLE